MDPRASSLRVTKNAYFSLLAHVKQILLVTFCATTARIESVMEQEGQPPYGWTDVNVEIVM